ncbi:metallophosphoesterase [Neobacillus sp. YIM B02564]|uniref:Metallophosphoesterase n=1 Tax=Neobacillus paridis TaxID=2803862 RepID=A0ABS1TKF2_9BACI|nr:metallophosphoesterase family protein [Neobacillus paridis]MBL4950998.1 metallophosphoesterase [Neobacillus paridis]
MSDNPILKRKEEESFLDYQIRLFSNKDEYEIDSYQIADLLNAEYGSNYSESKWRKDYAAYVYWKDYIISKNLDDEILDKYEKVRIESEKEKIRKNDQKREYRKLISNQARFEAIKDDIYNAILHIEKKKPLYFDSPTISNFDGKEGLALFSDWHYGMDIDNSINVFNKDIFNKRINKLINKIIEYGTLNNISTLHIANLGDLVGGLIHVSTRVQANEDVIGQIKYVSETLSEILNKLSSIFPMIKFYNVVGNHGRTQANKHDVGMKENFEYLIPWYLEARLRNHSNIEIITEQDGYITTSIFNNEIVFVHGNYDRVDQCVTRLPQVLGYVPDYIIGGHVHHNYEKEYGATTVIVNSSLIGVDDFAMQGRFCAKPSQKFMIFDKEEGLESTYIIKLK